MNFQNLFSSLAIISLSLFSLIFLSPRKEILDILVISPLLISNIKSKFFASISFTFVVTSAKL